MKEQVIGRPNTTRTPWQITRHRAAAKVASTITPWRHRKTRNSNDDNRGGGKKNHMRTHTNTRRQRHRRILAHYEERRKRDIELSCGSVNGNGRMQHARNHNNFMCMIARVELSFCACGRNQNNDQRRNNQVRNTLTTSESTVHSTCLELSSLCLTVQLIVVKFTN